MKRCKVVFVFFALLGTLFVSGCVANIVSMVTGAVGRIVTGGGSPIPTAETWIPDKAPDHIPGFIEEWDDPGFSPPSNNEVGHSGDTSDSYNSYNEEGAVPSGESSLDVSGERVNSQVVPSSDAQLSNLQDSYDAFNQ